MVFAYGVWSITLFQALDLFGTELDGQRRNGVLDVLQLGRADDRGSDDRLGEHPGQGYLRHWQAAFLSQVTDSLGDLKIFIGIKSFA